MTTQNLEYVSEIIRYIDVHDSNTSISSVETFPISITASNRVDPGDSSKGWHVLVGANAVLLWLDKALDRESISLRWCQNTMGLHSPNDGSPETFLQPPCIAEQLVSLIQCCIATHRLNPERDICLIKFRPVISIDFFSSLREQPSADPEEISSDPGAPLAKRRYNARTTKLFRDEQGLFGDFNGQLGGSPQIMDKERANLTVQGTSAFPFRSGPSLKSVYWSGHSLRIGESLNLAYFEAIERGTGHRMPADKARPPRDGETLIDYQQLGQSDRHETVDLVVDGQDLSSLSPVTLPASSVYYGDARLNSELPNTSNGCAVGGTANEAILSGFMELVERDASITAWYSGAIPEILEYEFKEISIDLRHTLLRLRMLGHTIRFCVLPSDFPAHIVLAQISDSKGQLTLGSSANFNLNSALLSALGEAASLIGDMERVYRDHRQRAAQLKADPWLVRNMLDHLMLLESGPVKAECETMTTSGEKIRYREQLDRVVSPTNFEDFRQAALKFAGSEIYFSNMANSATRQLGLAAYHVFAPNLIPIDFGAGSQRVLTIARYKERILSAALRQNTIPRSWPHPYP